MAFLPRHGRRHTIPPHRINYRANVWAMRSLGVKAVISPCAAGSLQLHVEPGHFVVSDQFVDRTSGRADTFFDGPIVSHVSSAEIYDPTLRALALDVIREHGITVHDGGTVVVIQGPRFSTRAESKWFSDAGWEVINMTQYPEAYLCRELGMAVVNIALITDYDAGVLEGTEAVTAHRRARGVRAERGADPEGGAGHDRALPGRPRRARSEGGACASRAVTVMRPRPEDVRMFETGLSARRVGWRFMAPRPRCAGLPAPDPRVTSAPTPLPAQSMHGCVRCGARIPISESMCEQCNPLGLQAPSASQAHGTVFLAIAAAVVILAVLARLALDNVGPFTSQVTSVQPGSGRPAGDDLDHERGVVRRTHHLPHRGSDARGIGPETAFVQSPMVDGKSTTSFDVVVVALGTTPKPLTAGCGS